MYSNEDVSYLAGWLGDATLTTEGTTQLKNGDYCADLDAENTFHYILKGYSSVNAISKYFSSFSESDNRATMFLEHISYDIVCQKVFYGLIDKSLILLMTTAINAGDVVTTKYYSDLLCDENYHWDTIRNSYPDTYNFLKSLYYKEAEQKEYI